MSADEQSTPRCESGEGIGPLISPEEGRRRLNAYADWCAKHTEGPWQRMNAYDGYLTIIGNVDGEIHPDGQETYSYDFICNCENEYGEATSHANVQLILAAPKLYAACYAAYQQIDGEQYPNLIGPLHAALVEAVGGSHKVTILKKADAEVISRILDEDEA